MTAVASAIGLAWRRYAAALALFFPFAAGYFMSYLFRTINGPIAGRLTETFGLDPRQLGLLTSMYFLTFAAFQIPAGLLIDRFGPHRVQAVLLIIAATGAMLFAMAPSLTLLMLGRALIGLGCSGALVTGVKALALWLPPDRRAAGNCCMVMSGGLGAIASTAPLEELAVFLPWRVIFVVLAGVTLIVAVVVWCMTPPGNPQKGLTAQSMGAGLRQVLTDPRFWRVAPLSASVVGAAFAIHGLWAARWLAVVAHLRPHAINKVLLVMGITLTCGAFLFGVLATLLRRRRVTTTTLLAVSTVAFLCVEWRVVAGASWFPAALFGAVAVFGSITVLSFTIMGDLFPQELAGRANGALNVLHLGTAFLFQAGIGGIVAAWPTSATGSSPANAYAAAFGTIMAIQCAALIWFVGSTPMPPYWARYLALRGLDAVPGRSVRYLAWRRDLDPAESAAIRRALLIAIVFICAIGLALVYLGVA